MLSWSSISHNFLWTTDVMPTLGRRGAVDFKAAGWNMQTRRSLHIWIVDPRWFETYVRPAQWMYNVIAIERTKAPCKRICPQWCWAQQTLHQCKIKISPTRFPLDKALSTVRNIALVAVDNEIMLQHWTRAICVRSIPGTTVQQIIEIHRLHSCHDGRSHRWSAKRWLSAEYQSRVIRLRLLIFALELVQQHIIYGRHRLQWLSCTIMNQSN